MWSYFIVKTRRITITYNNFITVYGDPDKCDSETPRKKVETAATFPGDPGIIANFWQKLYSSLAIGKDQDEKWVKGTQYAKMHWAAL